VLDTVSISNVDTLDGDALDIFLSNGVTLILEFAPKMARDPCFAWIAQDFPRPKTDGKSIIWADATHETRLSLNEVLSLLFEPPHSDEAENAMLKISSASMLDSETLSIVFNSNNQIMLPISTPKKISASIELKTDDTKVYCLDDTILSLTDIAAMIVSPCADSK